MDGCGNDARRERKFDGCGVDDPYDVAAARGGEHREKWTIAAVFGVHFDDPSHAGLFLFGCLDDAHGQACSIHEASSMCVHTP